MTSFWKSLPRFEVNIGTITELSKPVKGAEIKPSRIRRIGRWELEHAVRCIDKAVTSSDHRWIVTRFVRILVLFLLGIRHVCCNLHRLGYIGKPDFSKSPTPRYPSNETQRI